MKRSGNETTESITRLSDIAQTPFTQIIGNYFGVIVVALAMGFQSLILPEVSAIPTIHYLTTSLMGVVIFALGVQLYGTALIDSNHYKHDLQDNKRLYPTKAKPDHLTISLHLTITFFVGIYAFFIDSSSGANASYLTLFYGFFMAGYGLSPLLPVWRLKNDVAGNDEAKNNSLLTNT